MRRRFYFVLIVGALAMCLIIILHKVSMPVFKRRTVDAWFESHFGTIEELREADLAFKSMGTAALPYLRSQLQVSDSTLRNKEGSLRTRLLPRIGMKARILRPAPRDVRTRAVYLAAVAGGKEAIPDLITALKDPEPDVRIAAATALRSFGRLAAAAVPILSQLTNDAVSGFSYYAGRTVKGSAVDAMQAITGQDTNTYALKW